MPNLFVIVLWGSWGEPQDSQLHVAKAQIACAATGLAKLSTAQLCTSAAWFWNELDKIIDVQKFTTLNCPFLCFRPHFTLVLSSPSRYCRILHTVHDDLCIPWLISGKMKYMFSYLMCHDDTYVFLFGQHISLAKKCWAGPRCKIV